jgi:isoaspartyl peptidase/L-asparaginase-like protein (Ntn-hydrolase superfamily)
MENTPHNYLVGEGAEKLAEKYSLELVDPSYFSECNAIT